MARYVQDVTLNQPDDFVYFMMNDYMQKNSFKTANWKGNSVYRRGDGFFEGFRYLVWSYAGGVLHLEAWLKGPFGGEQGLTGFWGWAVKASYRSDLEKLCSLMQQAIPQPVPAGAEGAAPGQNVIQVQTMNNTGSATAALILGIVSIFLCWSPLLCLLAGCVAVITYRSGKGSTKGKLAKAGLICAIVGMSITAVLFVLNVLYVAVNLPYLIN